MWSYRRSSCSGSSRWWPWPQRDRRLRGSNTVRPPSESLLDTLLDTLFSLGLVAVVAGGVLLLYGLTQQTRHRAGSRVRPVSANVARRAGWYSSPCSPRSPTSRRSGFQPPEQAGDEALFGGRRIAPTTPDQDPSLAYEPSITWLPTAVILGLVLTAVIAYFVAERRARLERHPRAELAEELAAVLDDALDDLRAEADPRRAVIAAYARLERVLASSGIARRVCGDLGRVPRARPRVISRSARTRSRA